MSTSGPVWEASVVYNLFAELVGAEEVHVNELKPYSRVACFLRSPPPPTIETYICKSFSLYIHYSLPLQVVQSIHVHQEIPQESICTNGTCTVQVWRMLGHVPLTARLKYIIILFIGMAWPWWHKELRAIQGIVVRLGWVAAIVLLWCWWHVLGWKCQKQCCQPFQRIMSGIQSHLTLQCRQEVISIWRQGTGVSGVWIKRPVPIGYHCTQFQSWLKFWDT